MNLTTGLGWEVLIFILQTALILGLVSESMPTRVADTLDWERHAQKAIDPDFLTEY
jgi:hypothetical protein